MRKGLLLFLAFIFVFTGLRSQAEAKTHLEKAKEDLAVVEAIAGIPDSKLRHKAIMEYMQNIRPAIQKAVQSGLNKFAWQVGKNNWWIIYEHKERAITSAFFLKADKPPADATILDKGERL